MLATSGHALDAVVGGITSLPGALLGAAYLQGVRWFLPLEWQFLASGVGVLLVEQHVEQALAVADRGYVLNRGEIVLEGSVDVLKAQRAELAATYLGDALETT